MRAALAPLLLGAASIAGCGPAAPPAHTTARVSIAAARVAGVASGGAGGTPDDTFRYRPPALGARSAFHPPRVEELRASSGVRALVVEQHDAPLVCVDAIVSFRDAPALPGLPGVLADLLFTARRADGQNWFGQLTMRGSGADDWIGADTMGMRWATLPSELDATLDVALAAIRHPTITADELARVRRRAREAVEGRSDRDARTARVDALLYPATHRYHDPPFGDLKSLAKLSLAEVQRYADAELRPDDVTFAIAGDVRPDAVKAWLERATAGWKASRAPAPPRAVEAARGVFLVAQPGSEDVELTVRIPAPRRDDLEIASTHLLWRLLGWRLWTAMPKSDLEGWSDGSTAPRTNADRSELTFFVRVKPTGVAPALGVLLRELGRLANGEIPPEALADTRAALLHDLEAGADEVMAVADQLLPDDDLPFGALGAVHDALSHVTVDDLARVARARFGARDLRVVAIGDVAGLDGDIQKLGLGPIVRSTRPAAVAEAR